MQQGILGVDPGASGGLAILDYDTADILDILDMPSEEGVVVPPVVQDWLRQYEIKEAWIENVHSMPKQGVASSFKFGRAFGTIQGIIGANYIPLHFVTPGKWKKFLGVTSDKAICRQKANSLWPSHADYFKRVKDTDRAEACLVGYYGFHHKGGIA